MATTNDKTTTAAVVTKKPEEVAAVAPSPKMVTFRGLLEKMKGQLAIAMPKHLDVDRMLRIIFTTVQRTPTLLDCTHESLLGAIMQCAQLGLEPDGLLGHAYLVPFMNRKAKPARLECQLMVGYKGLLKLARQSGEIASVSARVVYSRDVFEYEYGINEKLRHVPYLDEAGDKEGVGYPVCAYAIFRMKDGSHHFDVMGYREIEYVRSKSQAATGPAWTDWWDEMAKKTVLRRASKMSPASVEDRMARAIALDELADAGLSQQLDGAVNSLALTAVPPEAPPPEGQRVPIRRPDNVSPISPVAGPPAAATSEEDPDAAARAAVAPTAAEIAAREAETGGAASDGEDLPGWAK